MERESVETSLSQIDALRNALDTSQESLVQSAHGALSLSVAKRRTETLDEKGRDVLEKLYRKLDTDGTKWVTNVKERTTAATSIKKTLDFLTRFLQTFATSAESFILESTELFRDPRPGREAAHALAVAALSADGKGLVVRAKKLTEAARPPQGVDASTYTDLKESARQLICVAQQHMEDSKRNDSQFNATQSKANLSQHCKAVYKQLANLTTQQHATFAQELRSRFVIYGTVVDVGLRHSLIALGSEPTQTKDQYLWTAAPSSSSSSTTGNRTSMKKQQQQQQQQLATASHPSKAASQQPQQQQQQQQQQVDRQLPLLGKCAACNGEIRGKILSALSVSFHPEHFACSSCRTVIAPYASFMPDPKNAQRPVCVDCSAKALKEASQNAPRWKPSEPAPAPRPTPTLQSFGPCGKCGQTLVGEYVAAANKKYHAGCFNCGGCGRIIAPSEEFGSSNKGQPCCKACLKKEEEPAVPEKSMRPKRTTADKKSSAAAEPERRITGGEVRPKRNTQDKRSGVNDEHEASLPVVSKNRCASCGLFIEGKEVTAFGKSFHRHHFLCGTCGSEIGQGKWTTHENGKEAVCDSCVRKAALAAAAASVSASKKAAPALVVKPAPYKPPMTAAAVSASEACAGCAKTLQEVDTILRDGRRAYHKECFACWKCNKFLGDKGADFFEAEGHLLCRPCYTKRMFRCTACGQGMVTAGGTEVEVGGNLYHSTCAPGAPPAINRDKKPSVAATLIVEEEEEQPRRPSKPLPAAVVAPLPPPPEYSSDDESDEPPLPPPAPKFESSIDSVLMASSPPRSPSPPVAPPAIVKYGDDDDDDPFSPRRDGEEDEDDDIVKLLMLESAALDQLHRSARASRNSDSKPQTGDVGEDELDELMGSLTSSAIPSSKVLPKPRMRTSRISGFAVEECWACGASNPSGYQSCFECGEGALSISSSPPQITTSAALGANETAEFFLDDDDLHHDESPPPSPPPRQAKPRDSFDDLGKLISDLEEI